MDRTGNLDQNETLAYNAIRVAGNMGKSSLSLSS